MKEIKLRGVLAGGKVVIVDDEDFDLLNRYNWSIDSDGYAVSSGYRYKMHRLIVAAPKKKIVDHINRNRLDNRKENLRLVSSRENSYNHNHKIGKSGYRGVNLTKDGKKWESCISVNDKQVYLGTFDTVLEAAEAYNTKAVEVRGSMAVLNPMR